MVKPVSPAVLRLPAVHKSQSALAGLKKTDLIELNLRGADIDNVLDFYGAALGLTVIKDPSLKGTATLISPKPLTVEEAYGVLELYLQSRGYQPVRTSTTLLVRPAPLVDPQAAEADALAAISTRVFPLVNAQASAVAKIINDLYAAPEAPKTVDTAIVPTVPSKNSLVARASAEVGTNSVVVSATPLGMAQVALMLKELDVPRTAVPALGEPTSSQVYSLKYIRANEAAPVVESMLQSSDRRAKASGAGAEDKGAGAPEAPRQSDVAAHVESNSLVVTATKSQLAAVSDVILKLDQPKQLASNLFWHHLSKANASEVASLLNSALRRPESAADQAEAGSEKNPQGDRLTGTGAPAYHQTFGEHADQIKSRQGSGSKLPSFIPGGDSPQVGFNPVGQSTETALVALGGNLYQGATMPLDPDADGIFELKDKPKDATAAAETVQPKVQLAQATGSSTTGTIRQSRGAGGAVTGVVDLQGNVSVVADVNSNSLIINADPASMEALKDILTRIDVLPEQVLIEALIIEASLDTTTKLGIQWNFTQMGAFGSGTAGTPNVNMQPNSLTGGLTYTAVGPSWQAVLGTIATDRRFKVLSTPRIFTSNNHEAQINISQQVPYITNSFVNANGSVSNSFSFLDVGVILDVTPHISSNGYVSIVVDQQANDFQGYTSFNAPLVARRSTSTTVTLKDGQTVVLGGLIKDSTTRIHNKVPILGDLPLIGSLFRSVDNAGSKTELMVFLTPYVVRGVDETDSLTGKQRDELETKSPQLNFAPTPKTIRQPAPKPGDAKKPTEPAKGDTETGIPPTAPGSTDADGDNDRPGSTEPAPTEGAGEGPVGPPIGDPGGPPPAPFPVPGGE
ncbi:MAG TPA: secretin N-terminal domain-containing protein [Armatimonadota bacterium]